MGLKEKHFVLVHGACHGAWCWYKVLAILKSQGHKVTALDMAACGIHPKQVHELKSSISSYHEPLIEFMESLPADEKIILVGHSRGGVAISVAMEMFPHKISVAVFATASLPGPDFTYPTIIKKLNERVDYMDSSFTKGDGPNSGPIGILFGPNLMASQFYQLSPPEDLHLAVSLVRPAPLYGDVELLLKETASTKQRYGSVRRVYILCDGDNVITEDLQRWMIEMNPPDEVKLIAGADHMVMCSKPVELCSCLLEIASHEFSI